MNTALKRRLIALLEALIVWLEGPPSRGPSPDGWSEDDVIEDFLRSIDLLDKPTTEREPSAIDKHLARHWKVEAANERLKQSESK